MTDDPSFCTIEYVESIFKNFDNINNVWSETILGSLCKRCYNKALVILAKKDKLPLVEI